MIDLTMQGIGAVLFIVASYICLNFLLKLSSDRRNAMGSDKVCLVLSEILIAVVLVLLLGCTVTMVAYVIEGASQWQ